MAEERLTIEDRVLFAEIANDIKSNPSDYQEAVKWLDEYCTKGSFRERTEEYKNKLEDGIKKGFPLEDGLELAKCMLEADIYLSFYDVRLNEDGEEDVEATKKIIENSKVGYRLYLYLYTWRDTIWHLIGNWDTKINLGIKNSRRVLLITWLLTRSDLENDSPEPNVSKFEEMPSEKKQSLYHDIFDLRQRRGQQWMEAIHVAWQTVKIERETATQASPSSEEATETEQENLTDTEENILEALGNETIKEQELLKPPGGGQSDNNPAGTDFKNSFTLMENQVLFDGQDLNIGAGASVDIFKALVENFGYIVSFKKLDENSLQNEASEKTRTAIGRIRKTLKSAKIPVVIENRKAEGYIMLPIVD